MKDILLVISDQHGQAYTQMEEPGLDTPELLRIAGDGLGYNHCYCNAPLCVPSRMSFLSGKLPSELGIFNNDSTLPADVPTIAHALGLAGYRTVLAGRMHFKGEEQDHGFDERLVGDITSQYWGTGGAQRTDFGSYAQTTNRKHCLEAVGGGYSPVMAYDASVFEAACRYLEEWQKKPDREPLFMVVGFYGPHFPFVCEPELYEKYKKRLLPNLEAMQEWTAEPEYEDYQMDCTSERALHCKAAYFGQVEKLDWYVGQLYDTFRVKHRDYAFLYTSDHGEQLGKRGLFGKQSLYEDAVRVPLIVAGTGIGKGVCEQAVSLLDVSAAILKLAGAEASWHDGNADRLWEGQCIPNGKPASPVAVQQILEWEGDLIMAEAVIAMPFKAVRYQDKPVKVFHLETDPWERQDIAGEHPDVVEFAERHMLDRGRQQECLEMERKKREQQEWMKAWGRKKQPKEWATVQNPSNARGKPVE